MLACLDRPVMRLIRVAFGPIHRGELEQEQVDEVPTHALENLFGVRTPRKQGWAKPKPRPNQNRRRPR